MSAGKSADVVAGRQRPSLQVNSPVPAAASGRGRRPILIAAAGLAVLVVGAAGYLYADDLIELASVLTSSRAIHVQGHIRY